MLVPSCAAMVVVWAKPAIAGARTTEAIGAETTSCATDMAVKISDLLKLQVTFDNLGSAPIPQILTQASTNCHLLNRGRPANEDLEPYLLTAQQMTDVVRDSVYHITFSNEYTQSPFFIPGNAAGGPTRQEKYGWWSEIDFGAAMWGMQCEPGSVVAAHERVRSAHCINVNARVGEDVIIKDKLPASALCETGHAVGGWFNLQGAKRVYRRNGNLPGPPEIEQVALSLNCRYVPGLSRLCEIKDGACDQDEVVTGLEFINATSMKYKCCKMPRTFGQTFVPGEGLEDVKVWEGYYCPETLDVSGRPEYQLDEYIGAAAVGVGTELWDTHGD